MNDEDVNWIRKKLWEWICTTYISSDEMFKKRSLERHIRSMIRHIEEVKPPDIRVYVEKELKKDAYSERISMIWGEATRMKEPNYNRLDELDKELTETKKKLKKEFPKFYQEIGRTIASAGLAIYSKKTGKQVET